MTEAGRRVIGAVIVMRTASDSAVVVMRTTSDSELFSNSTYNRTTYALTKKEE